MIRDVGNFEESTRERTDDVVGHLPSGLGRADRWRAKLIPAKAKYDFGCSNFVEQDVGRLQLAMKDTA
jgi:hypothetical protein